MLGRRKFLGGMGAAAAGVAVARGRIERPAGSASASPLASTMRATSTGPGEALANPLAAAGVREGATFGTCTVTGVKPTEDGSIAVSLTGSDGRRFELELLGHDARTPGVARGGSLAVYVNNRGRGDTRTDEEHGLAAMALAAHLGRREAAGVALPALPTLAERSRRARVV